MRKQENKEQREWRRNMRWEPETVQKTVKQGKNLWTQKNFVQLGKKKQAQDKNQLAQKVRATKHGEGSW